jgi:hypothetical protein
MWPANNFSLDFGLVSGRRRTTNLDDDNLHRLVAVNTKSYLRVQEIVRNFLTNMFSYINKVFALLNYLDQSNSCDL